MTEESKAAAEATEAPKTESTAKEKGPARPRKWNYGIIPEATVVRMAPAVDSEGKEVPFILKADVQKEYDFTEGDPKVSEFFSKGGTRHGLRVLCRKKAITIRHPDGAIFPIPYVAPPKPAPKPKAAKKKAAKAKATGAAKKTAAPKPKGTAAPAAPAPAE